MEAPGVPVHLRSWMCAVGEIARAANAGEPVHALLGRVAAWACALIGFDYCAVLLVDGEPERLRMAGSFGLTADYVDLVSGDGSPVVHPSDPALDTPAARAYRQQRTVVADVQEDDRHGRLRLLAAAQAYRVLVAVPLRPSGEQLGGLVGYSEAPGCSARASRNWPSCWPIRPRWRWRTPGCGPPSRRPSASCRAPTRSSGGAGPPRSGRSGSTTRS